MHPTTAELQNENEQLKAGESKLPTRVTRVTVNPKHSILGGNCRCGLPSPHEHFCLQKDAMRSAPGVISGSEGSRWGWPASSGCWCDTYLGPPERFHRHHVKGNIAPLALGVTAAVWHDLFCSPANFSLVPLRVDSRQEEKNDSSCQTAVLLLHHLTSSLLSVAASLRGGTSLTPLLIWEFCCFWLSAGVKRTKWFILPFIFRSSFSIASLPAKPHIFHMILVISAPATVALLI